MTTASSGVACITSSGGGVLEREGYALGRGDVTIGPNHKGFPPRAIGQTVARLRGKLGLDNGDFVTPVLLLYESALDENLRAMQRFCDRSGLSLAPHVKTTMSPEVIARQLQYGAWAVTVATGTQAVAVRSMGVERILLANELVDPLAIEWLGSEMDRDTGFAAYCYVDSVAGVRIADEVLSARDQRRQVPVLIEYGVRSGRAGVRSIEEAARLAEVVQDSSYLKLAGVAGFEGIVGTGLGRDRLDQVTFYLERLREVADYVYERLGRHAEEFLVTAGGSCFFELVRHVLDSKWRAGRPIRVILRSGCYVTHDSAASEDYRKLVATRFEPLPLTSALELWARVISRPEPRLAIVDFGRRDVGIDAGLPVLQHVLRRGAKEVGPAPRGTVVALNDQHAFLRVGSSIAEPSVVGPDVGDLVGLGISHPCTTFDKWRLIPIVDDHRTLSGIARTWF